MQEWSDYGWHYAEGNIVSAPDNTYLPMFNISDFPVLFETGSAESFYLLVPPGIRIFPLGSFSLCNRLVGLVVPPSVDEFGCFTFFNSGLQNITIAPDAKFYEDTFPDNCNISYYPVTIQSPETVDLVLYQSIDNQYMPVPNIIIANSFTRNANSYKYVADTSQVAQNQTGYIVGASSNVQIGSFTYNVQMLRLDVSSYTWEQGSGNGSTGSMDVSSTTRIRCADYIQIQPQYTKIKIDARDTYDTELYYDVYLYSGSTFILDTGWLQPGTWINLLSGTTSVRIILRYSDNTTIDVPNLEYCAIYI